MAYKHYYNGPALVNWTPRNEADGALGTKVNLGVNRENIAISVFPIFGDVPCDDWGGTEANPADMQFLGGTAEIALSLTKVETQGSGAPADQVDNIIEGYLSNGKTVGQFTQFGEFIRQGNYMGVLELDSQTLNARADASLITFDYCFMRGGGAHGVGTRYASYEFVVEAQLDAPTTRKLMTKAYTTP